MYQQIDQGVLEEDKAMNAKENKALAFAAVATILLSQPVLARGGGFGGGYGGGFASSSHGLGAIGVHGFNSGYTPQTHGESKSDFSGQGDRVSNDKPTNDQQANNRNYENNNNNQ